MWKTHTVTGLFVTGLPTSHSTFLSQFPGCGITSSIVNVTVGSPTSIPSFLLLTELTFCSGIQFSPMWSFLIRVLPRNRTNRDLYRERERERKSYFKELAHAIVRFGKSETVGQADELEIQIRVDAVLSMKSERQASRLEPRAGFLFCSLEAEFLFWETSVFALKAFSWLDEAHPLYIWQSALLKVY